MYICKEYISVKSATRFDLNRPFVSALIRPEIPILLFPRVGDENDDQDAKLMGVKGFL